MFQSDEAYAFFIRNRTDDFKDDLWKGIWNSMRNHPLFKGANYPVNGESVLLFKDGIGIKVTIEIDHAPTITD